LNRDTGEFGLNSIYDNLLKSNKINLVSLNNIDLFLTDNETSHKKSSQRTGSWEIKETAICNCFEENERVKKYLINLLFCINIGEEKLDT